MKHYLIDIVSKQVIGYAKLADLGRLYEMNPKTLCASRREGTLVSNRYMVGEGTLTEEDAIRDVISKRTITKAYLLTRHNIYKITHLKTGKVSYGKFKDIVAKGCRLNLTTAEAKVCGDYKVELARKGTGHKRKRETREERKIRKQEVKEKVTHTMRYKVWEEENVKGIMSKEEILKWLRDRGTSIKVSELDRKIKKVEFINSKYLIMSLNQESRLIKGLE